MAELTSENLDVNTPLIEAADGSISETLISTSYFEDYLFKVLADLNAINDELLVAQTAAYTVTNLTLDRDYDADATTVAELADVLGTLIADLKLAGIIQ